MKKAFTLVELLIVVVVLVTLMTITFRLVSIGGDSSAKNLTMNRLHRLENALSGYYAAFGTYPPVKLHGLRNPFLRVSPDGIQDKTGSGENVNIWGWLSSDGETVRNSRAESDAWEQVRAACLSQPVACNFPFGEEYSDIINIASEYWKNIVDKELYKLSDNDRNLLIRGFDNGVSRNIGRFAKYKDDADWTEVQIFRFGLMSYLLPRYLVMMNGEERFYTEYAQWLDNNELPNDPLTGRSFSNWANMRSNYVRSNNKSDLAHVANISSQAVCSRWMANFEKALYCTRAMTLYGVDIRDPGGYGESLLDSLKNLGIVKSLLYSPGGGNEGASDSQYLLDCITIKDGWNNDFFYYSPPPYQNYIVWSAGPNGRTFPPWIDRAALGGDGNRCVGYWVRDDIVNISH